MSQAQSILLTLIVYKIVLVLIGVWASRRTRDNTDFFLGGRHLGPTVAAISASASSSSAWTLLSVSGMAYLWGLPALWLFPATLMGFLINWVYVAPRLMRESRNNGAITLTEFLADSVEPGGCKGVQGRLRAERPELVVLRLWRRSSDCERALPGFLRDLGYVAREFPWRGRLFVYARPADRPGA